MTALLESLIVNCQIITSSQTQLKSSGQMSLALANSLKMTVII